MNFKQKNPPSTDLFFLGGIVVFALSLKLFYAFSNVADLRLFLAPVSWLVSFFTGASYQFSAELGYLFPQFNIVIERSCSGVNFFIMAFCMVSISTLPFYRSLRAKTIAVLSWGALTFAFTIFANSSRILIAINSLQFKDIAPWIATDKVHEAQGILVYLFFLIALSIFAQYFNQSISKTNPQAHA